MSTIIIITGQTATGKTSLAYSYAKKLHGEIINADARQVYKYLDIISGKDPLPEFPTYLYDIVDPKEYFSSFDWSIKAIKCLVSLINKGKTPIIAGGSYLYIKHLLYGIETEGVHPDWELRKKLDKKTVAELQDMLTKISPHTLEQLNQSDKNNPRRLMRKIELAVAHHSKIPVHFPKKDLGSLEKFRNEFGMATVKFIGLRFAKNESLISAITQRVEERIKMGAFDEVKKILEMGYTEHDPGLQTIGYQQLIKFFRGKLSREQAIDQWKNKEIQYAKRQFTFMKKDKNIHWQLASHV